MARIKSSWGALDSAWLGKPVTVVNTHPCAGAKGIVRKRSQKTGCLTVELTQPHGCYKAGESVSLMPYEVTKD